MVMDPLNDIRKMFNPTLFWDAREIDPVHHADYVIARVLDYGDEKDLKCLRSIYSDEALIKVIKTRRDLQPITRRFWSVYFKLASKEERDVSGSDSRKHPKSD